MTTEQIRQCDNASVGVIITDTDGRLLLIDRATPPFGRAPVAGHIDKHGGPEAAAHVEVSQEVGFNIAELVQLSEVWLPNPCRRPAGPQGVGHQWTAYRATVRGHLHISPREARSARWHTRDELQALAQRTAAYAIGGVTAEEFRSEPGLQPVWARLLAAQRLITLSAAELTLIDDLDRSSC